MNRSDLVRALTSVPLGIEKYKWEPELLTHREADAVVSAVFDLIGEALKDGETVGLEFGTFDVVEETRPPTPGRFLGREMVLYKRRKKVRFTPWFSAEDGSALNAPTGEPPELWGEDAPFT